MNHPHSEKINKKGNCHFCGREVNVFYELEDFPIYTRPVNKEDIDKVPLLPLEIGFCEYCDNIQQINSPGSKELDKIYNIFYRSHYSAAETGINAESAYSFSASLDDKVTGKTMLEIGSGDGYFLNIMQDKGWEVYGCDPSPQSDIAMEKYNLKIKKDIFSHGSFDRKFDCIVLRHVLEHISEPKTFLKEISLSLQSDGFLGIEVPNVLYILSKGIISGFYHEHIYYFTPYLLNKILKEYGFKVISIKEKEDVIYAIGQYAGISETNFKSSEIKKADTKNLISGYIWKFKTLRKQYTELNEEIRSNNYNLYLYGASSHTTQLLSMVQMPVKALIDKNESLHGKYLPIIKGVEIISPDILKTLNNEDTIVISSHAYQDEIIGQLRPWKKKGFNIIKLYPEWKYIKY